MSMEDLAEALKIKPLHCFVLIDHWNEDVESGIDRRALDIMLSNWVGAEIDSLQHNKKRKESIFYLRRVDGQLDGMAVEVILSLHAKPKGNIVLLDLRSNSDIRPRSVFELNYDSRGTI